MEDLTETILKLGVVSFQLPCNDNMVLAELMDSLRRVKEVKRVQEEERKIEKKRIAKMEKKKRKVRIDRSGWERE